jgi:hypothetical protein
VTTASVGSLFGGSLDSIATSAIAAVRDERTAIDAGAEVAIVTAV